MDTDKRNYCIRHIFREGFIFTNIANWVLFANLTTRKYIYLRSGPTHECDCVRNTSNTVHVQGRIATFALWKWVIAPLLDCEFNHSRKCLEVPIREKLDSWNIWRIQYLWSTFKNWRNAFFNNKKKGRGNRKGSFYKNLKLLAEKRHKRPPI